MAVPTPTKADQDSLRGCLQKNNILPVWDKKLWSLAPLDSELEWHDKEVENLKVRVRELLFESAKDLTDNVRFINLLRRLGASYHFEDEIKEQLGHIFSKLSQVMEDNQYDLSTLANLFRISRQYGYNMSTDVFKKFKGEDGEFKKDIIDDVEGILSLYEASFLAVEGEDILDEALAFTKQHLKKLAENSGPRFQNHIKNALMCPSHRTIERLDALNYISFYQEDEFADETLLKFAKWDYNRVQLYYKKEIAMISKWRESIDYMGNFPYARNRDIEAYMWTVGSIFEPQYSLARMTLYKHLILGTVMDDIYDSYGTIDELKLFTNAWQRLTMEAGDDLPEYMKVFYRMVIEETEKLSTGGCSCKTSYVKEMTKEIARCYLVEATWKHERAVPSFDEYLKIGKVTSTYDILTSAIFLGIESMGMQEIIWVRSDPKSSIGAKLTCRLLNDIGVKRNESSREDFPKGIDCYAKQYGLTEDEAAEGLLNFLESVWKGMNEDLVKPTNVSRILVKYNFNFARASTLFYRGVDMYTYASNLKPLITSMFLEPLPM